MTIPGRSVFFYGAWMAPLLVAGIVEPFVLYFVLAGNLALVGACLVQGHQLGKLRLSVEREGWSRLELDRAKNLVYRIENISGRAVRVTVRQLWPSSFVADQERLTLRIEPGEAVRVGVEVTPQRRGRIMIAPAEVDIRFESDFGRYRRLLPATEMTVYPNLGAIGDFEKLRRHHALSQIGIHRMRLIGLGREFDCLRAYQPDDEYRHINWKATARKQKPITNVYQTERTQDLMLCLDCGRMMGNPIGEATALDRAIDAAVLLAHVSQRGGDRLGLALFRDTVEQFIKPTSGGSATTRLIEQLIDVAPENVFPSYSALISALRVNLNRRAMVFLFTDLNDPQLAANLRGVLPSVSRRHVFVVVSLRDALLEQVASGSAESRRGLYQVLAARELAQERSARVRELIRAGVQVLETDADSISVELINRYLEIKMRQLV